MKKALPEDFQTAESLIKNGMVDQVVHRKELKKTIATLLAIMLKHPQ